MWLICTRCHVSIWRLNIDARELATNDISSILHALAVKLGQGHRYLLNCQAVFELVTAIGAAQILLSEIGVPILRVVLGNKISAVQVDYIHNHFFVRWLCLIDCRLSNAGTGLNHLIRCDIRGHRMTQRIALHLVVVGLGGGSGYTLILTSHGLRLLLHCG